MDSIKFLILDSKAGKYLEEMFDMAVEDLDTPVKITLAPPRKLAHLPKGYDGYLIHLSDTSEEAIEELRKAQHWCKIFGIFGGGVTVNLDYFDGGSHGVITLTHASHMIRQVQEAVYSRQER